ncbi:MAG: hypothetical protein OEW21_13550, partial [Betaproteobacteria bacterium]|nr:hypothetical protein [Betaproteobacteria bacterium]
QQKGRAARERRTALGKRMRGYAVWLTVVCSHFEVIVMLSVGIGLVLLAPAGADPGFEFSRLFSASGADEGSVMSWADSAAYAIAVSIIEPFYIAAGFSLYLNRRAVLEGWDIEIALRRLEARLETAPRPAPDHSLAALLAATLLSLATIAVAPPEAQAAPKQTRQEIREVLRGHEFPGKREEMTWTLRGNGDDKKKEKEPSNADFWLTLGQWIARIAEGIAWLLAVGIAAWLLFKAIRYFQGRSPDDAPAWRAPEALFGLSLAPGSLPDDVAASAAALLREGSVREALSLLYRGALSVLVHRDRVPLSEAHTEGDCLRAARPSLAADAADYFGRLVRVWTASAYAGRLPETSVAEALARDWDAHFGARRETAAADGGQVPA